MLKLAENLVEARITIFDRPSGEVIDMLRLQRLYTTPDIFDFIRAPALVEITVNVEKDEQHDLARLDSLVARSGCTLRRLSFEGSPTAHIATHVLPKHPSITELAIVINEWARYNATNALISHLTIPTSIATEALSSQLSAIYVGCPDESCIDYALYLKMLQSRWKADGCAPESAALLIDEGAVPDAGTLSGIDLLRQDGLDLLLLTGKEASDFMDDLVYIRRRWTKSSNRT
ncbi:hypothetical protein C8R44DRAFT_881465 [Mycena epipterygia]|nr:hypothetical protein C8R44DRAFT_881465 [Mycena epipterygia]